MSGPADRACVPVRVPALVAVCRLARVGVLSGGGLPVVDLLAQCCARGGWLNWLWLRSLRAAPDWGCLAA